MVNALISSHFNFYNSLFSISHVNWLSTSWHVIFQGPDFTLKYFTFIQTLAAVQSIIIRVTWQHHGSLISLFTHFICQVRCQFQKLSHHRKGLSVIYYYNSANFQLKRKCNPLTRPHSAWFFLGLTLPHCLRNPLLMVTYTNNMDVSL